MAHWQGKLRGAKLELKDATEASTASLNTVANLFERQHSLEAALNAKVLIPPSSHTHMPAPLLL